MEKVFGDFLFEINESNQSEIYGAAQNRYKESPKRFFYEIFNATIYRPKLQNYYVNLLKHVLQTDADKKCFLSSIFKFVSIRSSQSLKNSVLSLLFSCSKEGLVDADEIQSEALIFSPTPKTKERLIIDVFEWFLDSSNEEFTNEVYSLLSNEDKVQALYPTVQNFVFNIESLSQNDYNLHRKLKNEDRSLKTVEAILKRDDDELFARVLKLEGFDASGTVQPSVYERSFLVNNNCPYASYCAFYGSNKCLKMLIDAGADLSAVDGSNVTIAQFAAAGGNKEALDLFKEKGLSFDGCAGFALKFHHLELAKELMKEGTNKNLLHRAASSGFIEGIKFALTIEDPKQLNANGRTALQVACQYSEDAAELLIPISDVNVQDNEGMTALHFAVVNGLTDTVRKLLACKEIDLSLSHRFGMNAILWACHDGHLDIVKLLLEDGRSSIDSIDEEKWTPLHHAIMRNNVDIALYLISKGANVNAKQNEGMTPLHYSATMGFVDCIKALSSAPGIDMNSRDEGGLTPLLWAVQTNHVEAVEALLEDDRVDPSLCDNDGANVLHWAAQSDLTITNLVKGKVDVNSRDSNGMTPLIIAATTKSEEFASDICAIPETDVNAADSNGMTTLHYAARNDDDMMINIIAGTGRADINKLNNSGITPLHIAASNGNENAVMAILMVPGARKDIKDSDGDLPIDSAKMFGYQNIVNLLK